MADPLASIRGQKTGVADAVRWACILEATAPKVGNVHPTQSFDDLTFTDFVTAANITAAALGASERPVARRMLDAVTETRRVTGTNVNLGIVLLLGPLVAAEFVEKESIAHALDSFTGEDGRLIYDAIRIAGAGGLGRVESRDVTETSSDPVDIVAAMKSAANRDRIALQYAGGFADLLENVVPVVLSAIHDRGDILGGIADAHLTLLSQTPDSLIARKCGQEVAEDVQSRARQVDRSDKDSIAALNGFLRSRGGLLNPGTTADLIAAALYVLLQTTSNREET